MRDGSVLIKLAIGRKRGELEWQPSEETSLLSSGWSGGGIVLQEFLHECVSVSQAFHFGLVTRFVAVGVLLGSGDATPAG